MRKKMKTFAKKSISTLRPLFSAKIEYFEILSGSGGRSTNELKIVFGKFL